MEDQPKTVLVTGSTSGIGLAIARRFAEAGYLVAVHGIETVEEATQALEAVGKVARQRPAYFSANLANYEESAHLPEKVIAEFGHVDVLVNNAGIQKVAPIDEFDFADFSRIVAISLDSAFHTIRAALPGMKERGWGRIVNIASAHGLRASPFKAPYVATKHAVVGLTKSVALEVAELGITCNAICPGYIGTEMVRAIPEKVLAERIVPQIPIGRLGEPEEIARCVLFLVSDEAGFITGSTMTANGGQYFA